MMNKRIKELAIQAGARFEFLHVAHYDDFDYTTFVELLILECRKVIDAELAATDIAGEREESWKMGMECSMALIKEHFGVE